MGLMTRALKNLLPRGSAWNLPTTTRQVVEALGASLERARVFSGSVLDESLPSTATETLAEWYAMLRIPYDATQTLATRRSRARQQWTATGGQSSSNLTEIIQIAYPSVSILPSVEFFDSPEGAGEGEAGRMVATEGNFIWAYFGVDGEVQSITDLLRLTGLIDRIAPAEMEPVYTVTIINTTPAGEAGLGMAGLMQAGRSLT